MSLSRRKESGAINMDHVIVITIIEIVDYH